MLKKIIDLLTYKEKINFTVILIMVMFMSMLDMIGVASIMPFMAVLSNPGIIESNNILLATYNYFSFESNLDFIFALGVAVFILLVTSLAFKALTIYFQIRFSLMCEFSLSKRMVEGYLHQPYTWLLNRNTSDINKTVLSEVGRVTNGCIAPLMSLITQASVCLAILVMLIFVDPILSISVGIFFALAYGVLYKFIRSFLYNLGEGGLIANKYRFKVVSEAFGAFKQVKLTGLEKIFINKFNLAAKTFARNEALASIIRQLPKYALEMVTFGGMLLIVLHLIRQKGGFVDAIPIIALYAFAGYRFMPALQQIYSSITQLKFIQPVLNSVHKDLNNLPSIRVDNKKSKINFSKQIKLRNINYTYPQSKNASLKDINIDIFDKNKIGIVGKTGSGKTTLVDLILGLLKPDTGFIEIDGIKIKNDNVRSWQSLFGYVPQQIYLSDESIACNIAFGIPKNKINIKNLEYASKISNIHDFIKNELPEGYNTKVGERGIRLSGGQRQRIGIARALYHKPKVLIFDEATTALDNITEKEVISALNNLDNKVTVIMIAHRLSTVSDCDNIFLMEKGEIVGSGKYDYLSKSNRKFNKLILAK